MRKTSVLWLCNSFPFKVFFVLALAVAVMVAGCANPTVRKQRAYEQGLALAKAGETRKAMLEFRNAVQADPKFVDGRFQLGIALLQLHSYEAALGELQRVRDAEPERPGLKPYLAEAMVGAGKFADGRELLAALINENPNDAAAHDFLARALLGLSQPQSAKQQPTAAEVRDNLAAAAAEAEKALEIDPKLLEPQMTLAQVAVLKDRKGTMPKPLTPDVVSEVEKRFDAAKKASPNDSALLRRTSSIWSMAGNSSGAMSEVDTALALAPDDPETRLMKLELLLDNGKVDEAATIYDKLVEEKLTSPRMSFLQGRILFAKNDFDKARDAFKNVKDTVPGGYYLARCFEKLGDHQNAQSQYEQVLNQVPTHRGARRELLQMFLGESNFAKALVQADEAVRAAQEDPFGYLLRAMVFKAQRDWAKAHEAVDAVLERAPGMFDALLLRTELFLREPNLKQAAIAVEDVIKAQPETAIGYLLRGEINLNLKEYAAAEKDAARATALAPKDITARMISARARIAQGDFDGAYAIYDAVVQMAPESAAARLAFARMCATRKEYDKAISVLNAIGENDAAYVEARVRMAELYDASGNAEAARAEFEHLLAAHPDAADATVGMFNHLARSQELGEMEEFARATLERDPSSALGHLMLSDVYSAKSAWSPAADEIGAALKKQPESARLWFRLGVLNTNAGRLKEALDALMRARELQPSFDAATLGAASLMARNGRGDEALDLCGKVLQQKPDDPNAKLTLADIKSVLGKDSEAESAYKDLIASKPAFPSPYLRLAALYERQKDAANVQKVFDAAILAAPKVAELYVEYGRFLERANDKEHAREQYSRALEQSPDNPQVQEMLARLSMDAGNYEDAEQRLRARLIQTPDDLAIRLNLALVLEKAGKTEEAAQSLLDFVTASKNPAATGMELSRLFASKGQYDNIERLARSLLSKDTTKWMPHYALGIARAGQGDSEGALTCFTEAATLNPQMPLAKHAQGLMLARLNKPDEALAAFDAASKIDAHFLPAYTDAALVCLRKGDYDGAENLCRKALEADAKAVEPVLLRAAVYAKSNRAEMALRAVNDLLEKDPQQAVAASAVADAFPTNGNLDPAIDLCKRCLAAAPDAPAITMRLGVIYEHAGKRDLAIAEYTRLIEKTPDTALAQNNLAWLLCEQGKFDEALPHAQRAQTLMPEHPSMQDTLGWIYINKKNAEKAVPLLESVTRRVPKNPTFQYHLGKAYLLAGRTDDARKALAQALALDTKFDEADDARKLLESMDAASK